MLIACAGVASPQTIRQLLRTDLDWEQILGRAVYYGTAPAMYCNLKSSAGKQLIATEIMARLRSVYRRSCVDQINALVKLKEILLAFSAAKGESCGNRALRAQPWQSWSITASACARCWTSTYWSGRLIWI